MVDSSKVLTDIANAEPIPEEDYRCKHESIEQRVRCYELLNACVLTGAAHADVAEYYPQYYGNQREWVDVVPCGTVRAICGGSVVNWFKDCLEGDYRRDDDKHNAYNSLEGFHDFLLVPERV